MPKIAAYSYEEYLHLIKSFHGNLAPGLIIGGFMVDSALGMLPEGEFFDAVCETRVCLPDAVQILTPCTIGNGWLKVFDYGRFALAMYEKYRGEGVRVYLDAGKMESWPEIKGWFLKLTPKREQDSEKLFSQIKQAGKDILSCRKVRIRPDLLKKKSLGAVGICPRCGEAYPLRDGDACRPCRGESPYQTV
ncbi:MAG: formylmethanofuran dehydrogenase subunit E family protein [Syntrophales bacterium]|nr:formylmethanofuran dehydrogenase subunit E family protein [Syntrophales bacterium]MDD5532037.1 formylmethanofuran dehydrogenase subunit E family protein [Syntrophales bacterium]